MDLQIVDYLLQCLLAVADDDAVVGGIDCLAAEIEGWGVGADAGAKVFNVVGGGDETFCLAAAAVVGCDRDEGIAGFPYSDKPVVGDCCHSAIAGVPCERRVGGIAREDSCRELEGLWLCHLNGILCVIECDGGDIYGIDSYLASGTETGSVGSSGSDNGCAYADGSDCTVFADACNVGLRTAPCDVLVECGLRKDGGNELNAFSNGELCAFRVEADALCQSAVGSDLACGCEFGAVGCPGCDDGLTLSCGCDESFGCDSCHLLVGTAPGDALVRCLLREECGGELEGLSDGETGLRLVEGDLCDECSARNLVVFLLSHQLEFLRRTGWHYYVGRVLRNELVLALHESDGTVGGLAEDTHRGGIVLGDEAVRVGLLASVAEEIDALHVG